MDLTQGTLEEKRIRAKKMMLWFGIISLIMSFAGWTSAYIVSRSRPDWLTDFKLPNVFITSTVIIVISSVTFILAKSALIKNSRGLTSLWLTLTTLLGLLFIYFQLQGFSNIIDLGYNFTGPTSNPKTSYIYIIAVVHILHVVAGLISLLVVTFNHYSKKYTPTKMLGFELAATFWHFVDILWVVLFLFLYFVK